MKHTPVCSAWFLAVAVLLSAPAIAQQDVAARTTASAAAARAAEALLAKRISITLDHVSLKSALDAIAARGGVQVQYRLNTVDAYPQPITVHASDLPLRVVFQRVLDGAGLQLVPLEGTLFGLVPTSRAPSQIANQGVIVGKVRDDRTGAPLQGVSVSLDGAANGVMTTGEGAYRITGVAAGSHTVYVKLLGYTKQTRTIAVADGESVTVDFGLAASANTLDQVVVTGTIIPTELKAVSNAITVITAKQIEERGITKIDQLFRGDIPGMFAINMGSVSPLDEVYMFVRGATALSGASAGTKLGITNPIKTYVDGVELADPTYLSQIDPNSIERIEILTGPQASTIYGSNAMNGVMQVFTKRGTSTTPQLTLNLLSGWVENNFSNAHTPQHDYSAQINGIEGRLSYNAGGSWNYMGPWTPAKQLARMGGLGGARLDSPTPAGRVTADMTFRRTITQNRQRGDVTQTQTSYQETGWWRNTSVSGLSSPTTSTLNGQTLGYTLGYIPLAWCSQEVAIGIDASDTEILRTGRGYLAPSDTTLYLYQAHNNRRSLRYTSTARAPLGSLAQATIIIGADAWQDLTSSWSVSPQTLTGSLAGSTNVSRQPGHNAGAFSQTQFGIGDRLFLTYGLRLEWNPNYGAKAQPNYSPRYGIAYTQDLGPLTAKVRASYGRATRPPAPQIKNVVKASQVGYGFTIPDYGDFDYYLANPELGPEHQQGGEGGIELYLGNRASLVVTRYNQTVDGLIAAASKVDSVRSFTPNPNSGFSGPDLGSDGYGYMYQNQYLNLGSIRNQGWEVQNSITAGPFTARGTYSWTKSRTIGVMPKYRSLFSLADGYIQYQPGATFNYLPEHTWAAGVTYARAQITASLNLTGTGWAKNAGDGFLFQNLNSNIRLAQNRLNMRSGIGYINVTKGYTLTDAAVSHRITSRADGVLQVQNLLNVYRNEYFAAYAAIGRQVKAGMRLRL